MHRLKRKISRLAIIILFFSLFAPGIVTAKEAAEMALTGNISEELLESFTENEQVTFLVKFKEKADTLEVAKEARINSIKRNLSVNKQEVAQRSAVISELKTTSVSSQEHVMDYLEEQQAEGNVSDVRTFYIVNGMAVTATEDVVQSLAAFPEVEKILPNETRKLNEATKTNMATPASDDPNVEWNVERVGAPEVWDMGIDGTGTVVAVIDSGVEWQHPALKEKYRGYNPETGVFDHTYSWFDATDNADSEPYDDLGHGTHVMGTIVGSEPDGTNKIGVAPGAQWIAVKAFTAEGGSDADLLEAAEWVLAPGGNVEMAPDVVNNSWSGGAGLDEWYLDVVNNWRTAGIFPEFSAGNTDLWNPGGPASIANPANYPVSFATGATDVNNKVGKFSLRGPSPYGEIKPDISAPGVNIRSSVPGGGYEGGWNGTSMAGPVVSGVVALLRQANPKITVGELEDILIQTATPIADSTYPESPNNGYGYGLVNAYKAVKTLMQGQDIVGPVLSIVSPVNGEKIHGEEILVEGTVSDRNLANVYINGEKIEVFNGIFSHQIQLMDGENIIEVVALDTAGNETRQVIPVTVVTQNVLRIKGKLRYDTAIEISKSGWKQAETVVVARGLEFADALAGVPLAYKLDAPILLTPSDHLWPAAFEEIERLGAENVVILGGKSAVSANVIAELEAAGLNVRRIAGANRFETAGKIAKEVAADGAPQVVVANGMDFPDALSAAAYAAKKNIPILLTKANVLPKETKAALAELDAGSSIVVGGELVISREIMRDLPGGVRISGKDRYGTNIALAEHFGMNDDHAYIATGKQYADALTGAVLAAREDSAIILVHNKVPVEVASFIMESNVDWLTVLGGDDAVSADVVGKLDEILR